MRTKMSLTAFASASLNTRSTSMMTGFSFLLLTNPQTLPFKENELEGMCESWKLKRKKDLWIFGGASSLYFLASLGLYLQSYFSNNELMFLFIPGLFFTGLFSLYRIKEKNQ